MDHNSTDTRTVPSMDPDRGGGTPARTGRWLSSLARFLIASALLMVGVMVALTGAITVVGLPLGLIIIGVGLDLIRAAPVRIANTRG